MVAAVLDLFSVFVENVFGGNMLFTIIGLSILLAIISMMGRMSLLLVSAILILFIITMMVGFFGSLVAIIFFTFSFIYFAMSIMPWIRGWLG